MYKRLSVIASAVIWILLPKCGACLMAYMGLFSALGLGRLLNSHYTLPVIWLLLAVNLLASLYLAAKKRQYAYALVSLVCASVFIVNKLYFDSLTVNILAGAVLVVAALRIRFTRMHKRQCLFGEETAGC